MPKYFTNTFFSPLPLAAIFILSLLALPTPQSLANQRPEDSHATYLPIITGPRNEQIVTYEEDVSPILNPERGFFDQTAVLWTDDLKFVLDMSEMRDRGFSIIRLYFVIDEFIDGPIDAETLDVIDRNFGAARENGIKIIPRFTYNYPNNDTYPEAKDAEVDQILEHLDQLKPIFEKNSDVIAYMNLGLVGAWGEWHSSSSGHVIDDENGRRITDNARVIVSKMLDVLPRSRAVTMRYPPFKQQLYGPDPLNMNEPHNGSEKSRMGSMNDCFLASKTDFGTYMPYETDADIEAIKDYLSADNLYLPMGGETCNSDERAEPYTGCDNAIKELERMRWSALNSISNGVIELWKTEGCYDKIAERLGYRFVLTEGVFPKQVNRGEQFSFEVQLRNDGFASPYNQRDFELILRHKTSGDTVTFKTYMDPRYWFPTYEIIPLKLSANLPADFPTGDYELLLNLPDPAPTLRDNPLYSIRLANLGTWEADSGYNNLNVTVEVR
ncbi:MAG: DUF4832 domain-containing protein [Anaerolineae bacterium]